MGYGNWPTTRNTSKWDMATGIGQLVAESQLPYPPGGPRFLEASEKHKVLHESSIVVMSAAIGPVPRGSNNPYKFIGFGAMEVTKACGVWGVTKPYQFIGFGAMEVTKPCQFIGFGAMEVPYLFVRFGAMEASRCLPEPAGPGRPSQPARSVQPAGFAGLYRPTIGQL